MHMQAGVHVVYKKFSFVPDLASSDTLVPWRHNLSGQQWYFENHWEIENTQD